MTEHGHEQRRIAEVVPELLAQADRQPLYQLGSGHQLMTYRSPNTGRPVLGMGLPLLYPSSGEVEVLLRLLGWQDVNPKRSGVQKHGCWWVFIEPPT